MSGGSGPIDKSCAERLLKNNRPVALHSQSSDVEIFKNLAMNRVAYFANREALYYTDSKHSDVQAVIEFVAKGLGKQFQIEQLYMDDHQYFRGPLRVSLGEPEARALLLAFRLNGIAVCCPN